jgi:hypothetical protein
MHATCIKFSSQKVLISNITWDNTTWNIKVLILHVLIFSGFQIQCSKKHKVLSFHTLCQVLFLSDKQRFSSIYFVKSMTFSFKFLITWHSWANLIKKQHTATSVLLHITHTKSITRTIGCYAHTRWTYTLYQVYFCTWHTKTITCWIGCYEHTSWNYTLQQVWWCTWHTKIQYSVQLSENWKINLRQICD